MSFTLSPNMNLPVPSVGNEQGPDYALDINNCMGILDQHTHAAGSGSQINPSGININTAFPINNNFLTGVAGVTLQAQSVTPAISTVYESGVDLFFVDGLGNNIRLTQSGGIAGTPGSIAGLAPPASATYVSLSSTFVWQSNTNIAANMDAGAYLFRNLSPNSTFALTLQAPAALASNYTITLPNLPVSTSFLTMDASGNIAASPAVVGALTATNLSASANILGTQLSPSADILGSQLSGSAGILGAQLVTNINLEGNAATENGKNIVVSNTNATKSIALSRMIISSAGALIGGEGASTARVSVGFYHIVFIAPFTDQPTVLVTPFSPNTVGYTNSSSTTDCFVTFRDTLGTLIDTDFNILVLAQRV